ncbi:nuclear pore complex protein Nup153 [Trichomycterus rosablanca]|uniref:nuclear pore complex protein Nup153 n=1 Tax=Trichomycterus rosablanca TaxID=2290929 RepID=UPI002F35386F
MAATGGGKIRTRRYHIVSKPYAKGKQQSGLISRVTDTVKSIVPSWLQRYFKNGEVAEGEEHEVEVERNNVPTTSYGNQEAASIPDGRNSPKASTSNTEPSTSRASLNFQDALSRPPLNRSHLHFPSHDGSPALASSSLFSQPSTSSAPFSANPFAVASNFSLVKEIKDNSSQHEDDNISTTSGFSSRASDKDVPTLKSAPLLWSPEADHTQSGLQLHHNSLKKPAFNLSVFSNSSSQSAVNNSVLNSSQLGDSPFYPGKTTYGGAAAAKSARSRPGTPYQAPVRRQIKAKPAGAQACGVTSATARRILQSLERMSSPLADAKRIPSTISSPLSRSLNHTDLDASSLQSKRKKMEPAVPPVQKLIIPAATAVSGNRSMSFRPSLTPGSVSRTVEKSNKETPVKQTPKNSDARLLPASSVPSTSNLSYPLSSTPAANVASGGGKMKRERSIRPSSKKADEEVAEVPELPAVLLPISNSSLPTFSFSTPAFTLTPSTKPLPCLPDKPAFNKENSTVSTPFSTSFTFSSPIVKATVASLPSYSPSSGFTFSAPTLKTTPSVSNGKFDPAVLAVKASASEIREEFEGPFKPAKFLKEGSVLDILKGPGFSSPFLNSSNSEKTEKTPSSNSAPLAFSAGFGDKFKPAAGSWNCDCCLVQNKASDKKCLACAAAKPNKDSVSKVDSKPAKAPAASLSSLFTVEGWECDTCLVRNKPEVVKCVACDTAKPGTGVKPALNLPPVSEVSFPLIAPPASSTSTTTSSSSTTSGLLGFGDQFKKPVGSWECSICMIQNKEQDSKCVACQNAKPGAVSTAPSSQASVPTSATKAPLLGFGDKFKKPEGSWECDVCCVQNKANDQQCVSCQTAKPGAKVESKGTFGTPSSNTISSSSAFKFGTSSSNSASDGLKFGGSFSDSSSNTGSFKFGSASSISTSDSAGFKFGGLSSSITEELNFGGDSEASTEPASSGTSLTGTVKIGGSADGLKFGTTSTPVLSSEENKNTSQDSGAGIKFGGSSGATFGSGAPSTAATFSSGGFSFGLSKPEANSGSNSAFSFSTPKAEKETASSITAISATATPAANTLPVFGKPPVAEPSTASSLGEPAAKVATLAPSTAFLFGGKQDVKKTSPVPSTGFMFNAAKEADKPAQSVGFSFSKPDPPKELPKPTFAFGKPAEPTETPKPAFGFGQNATDTSAPKPMFGFMTSSSSTPASSNTAPSLFGTATSSSLDATPAPSNAFIFGQNSSSDASTTKAFMFGQQQDSQPAPAEPSAAPAPSQPFVFGSANSSGAPTFAFGAAGPTQASAAPVPSAAPSPFGFNSSAQTSGFSSGETPGFGSSQPSAPAFGSTTSSFTATASSLPAFGAKPGAAPVFGQQSNPTPTFGSSAGPASQGGFQFVGAGAFGSSNSGSGVFTFGSGAAGNPPAQSAMSTEAFVAPNFNIGSTKTSFSSPSTGQQGIAGRKIKHAVRRRK